MTQNSDRGGNIGVIDRTAPPVAELKKGGVVAKKSSKMKMKGKHPMMAGGGVVKGKC